MERPDFFDTSFGQRRHSRLGRSGQKAQNLCADLLLLLNPAYRKLRKKAEQMESRKIYVVGVETQSRTRELQRVIATIANTRHDVSFRRIPRAPGKGKFQNINEGLATIGLDAYDWLIVLDDDVELPKHFLDQFIFLAEEADLRICQPAHTLHSYQSYELTNRRLDCLARVTRFVECGPLTAFHRSVLHLLIPFPDLRWAWGTDIYWGEIARREKFRIGIVDCTPMTHLLPVGKAYDANLAVDEALLFLQTEGIERRRESILENVDFISGVK